MKKFLALFLSIVLVLSFAGCNEKKGETPEQAVKNALDAIKAADVEKASKYVDYDKLLNSDEEVMDAEDEEQSREMAKMILGNLEYKILESSEDGDTATVKTEITNLDMSSVLGGFISQAFALAFSGLDEAQLNEKYLEIFTDLIAQEEKTITKTVNVSLSKDDGGWKIGGNDEFADALLGGLISYSDDINNAFENDENTESDKLNEINNWVIDDIWNKGFVDIRDYIANGTSSTGESMDIDFTIEQLDTAMTKKADYDNYVEKLSGEEYSQIKSIWGKLSSEIDVLYNHMKETSPKANDSSNPFDTGKFVQYRDAFADAVYDLN